MVIKLFDEPDRFGILSIHYGDQAAERYNRVLPRVLALLAPVLRAAIALNREIAVRASLRATLAQVLDGIALPALIVDGKGVLRFANGHALKSLEEATAMSLDACNRVRLRGSSAQAQLAASLKSQQNTDFHAPDIQFRGADGQITALLSLYPIKSDVSDLGWLFSPERLLLIIMRETEPKSLVTDMRALQHLFALTPAEARLASRLAAGNSLEEASNALGISKLTARTQLKSIFVKTDTHRQSQLILLLARLAPGS